MDDKYLPPSHMGHTQPIPVDTEAKDTAKSISKTHLRQALFPVRMILLSLLSVGLGVLLCEWLLPCFPAEMQKEMLLSHLPYIGGESEGESLSLPLQFLRLCLSYVPIFLVLAVAGLTSFSRSLTTWVSAYRCVCEGFAFAFLWQFAQNGEIPYTTCLLYGGCTLVWVCIRMAVSLSSTHTSTHFFDPETRLAEGKRGISPLLTRHTLICLACALIGVISCGIYVVLMHRIITS